MALQIIYPTDASKEGSCSLYFFSKSWIASSRRSFWRKPSWAASILNSLIRSASRVVLYIFLFAMLHPSSCRSIGNYKIQLNLKKGGPSVFRPPSAMVMWDECCSLPRLNKFYHNEKKSQYENYKQLKFIIILIAIFSTLSKTGIR